MSPETTLAVPCAGGVEIDIVRGVSPRPVSLASTVSALFDVSSLTLRESATATGRSLTLLTVIETVTVFDESAANAPGEQLVTHAVSVTRYWSESEPKKSGLGV